MTLYFENCQIVTVPEHPSFNTYHAFSVIHSRQILLKLFAHVEVHVVVLEGAEGFDGNVVAVVRDVLVGLEQGGDFPDGNIHICNRLERRAVTTTETI